MKSDDADVVEDEATEREIRRIRQKRGKQMSETTTIATTCSLCGQPAAPLSTIRCDRCWELERRISDNPELARGILAAYTPQPEPDAGAKEWCVYKTKPERKTSDVELYGCGEPLRLPWHREEFLEQVVVDHASAALVPKLVAALETAREYIAATAYQPIELASLKPELLAMIDAALVLAKGRQQ